MAKQQQAQPVLLASQYWSALPAHGVQLVQPAVEEAMASALRRWAEDPTQAARPFWVVAKLGGVELPLDARVLHSLHSLQSVL